MSPAPARKAIRRVVADRRARLRPAPPAPIPVVKWAGGKSRLLDELVARRPASYRRYYEPFAGGGALFFCLAPRYAVIGDSNADLINVYRCIAWHVESVVRRLAHHRRVHCEEHYYRTRSKWNARDAKQSDVARAAAFIYLNKTCYNGLWRVNKRGLFNVPMGRYESPTIYDPVNLRAASRLLQRADLRPGDYAETLEDAGAGDFVYLDPPYQPLSDTAKFTSYTADSFGEDEQHQLAAVARQLVARGCHVMISNHDTPLIRELYAGFRLDAVECARAINSRGDARGAVAELVITADPR